MSLKNCTSINWPDCPCYKLATDRGYARCARELDCHLTPADFARLRAMIAGEYNCGHCGSLFDLTECVGGDEDEPCPMRDDEPESEPCRNWTPRTPDKNKEA